jgi:hypothetical protein
MIFPISFSIPRELVVPYVPFKIQHTATHTYQFDDSNLYLQNYRGSLFADTTLKCGWDCLRHYEILSQGTIPNFYKRLEPYCPNGLVDCPTYTMFNYPKKQTIRLIDKYGSLEFSDIMRTSSSELYEELDELLRYTRVNLTNEASADYVLSTLGVPESRKILYLANIKKNESDDNYLYNMLVTGFKNNTKGECDLYPELDHHYKSFSLEETKKMYGKGFNYTRSVDDSYRNKVSKEEIVDRVKTGYYDKIVIFMAHRNELNCNEFIDANSPNYIFKYYSPTNIAFICGHDCDSFFVNGEYRIKMWHECHLRSKVLKDISIFIRECGPDTNI